MKIKVTVEGYAKYNLKDYVPEGAVIKSYSIEHDDITIHYTLNGQEQQCCRSLNLLSHTEDHVFTQIQEINDDNDVEEEEEEDNVIEGANYRHGFDAVPDRRCVWTKHSDGTHKRYNTTGIDLTKPKGYGRW